MTQLLLRITKPWRALLIGAVAATSLSAFAQTPTAAQIEQFKRLPPAQQQALARQMGIDLEALGQSSNPQPQIGEIPTPLPVMPQAGKGVAEQENADTDETEKTPRLKPFGYDLFGQSRDSFFPAVDVPIPADYVMGPGDTVVVQLYGKENASYSLVVNREGQVQFPEIGPINLAGLKFSAAQEVINQTVAEQMIGVKSSVTMGSLRSIRVFVLGDARFPGSYTVNSLSTMTNALFASGGVDVIGSLRNIQLKRSGELITTMDLYDLLLHGDTSKDERLLPGDVIFIPPVGNVVAVDGEVKRPAIYELKKENTLAEVVKLAGGYTTEAHPPSSHVERIDKKGNRTVIDIDLGDNKGKRMKVANGDMLVVESVLDTLENIVTLDGHVKRPGRFNWHDKLRVSDIVPSVYALKPNPDLEVAMIVREQQPTRRIEVLYFNLAQAISNPGSEQDLQLQARDKLVIFGYGEDRGEELAETVETLEAQSSKYEKARVVSIRGLVRYPAKYPLSEGLTLKSFIEVAGGLDEFAYGLEAEVTRYHYGDDSEQYIEHIPVKLTDAAAAQTLLEPSDSVTIKRIPNWIAPETVTIEGEVAFPGVYTLQRGETLNQVIKRAGGLTDYAYPQGAIFSRESLRKLEAERLEDLQEKLEADIAAAELEQQDKATKASTVDANEILEDLKGVKPQGRMVIDLPSLVEGDELADVQLVDGDRLLVPRFKQSITVVGEVQYPTSHLFEDKLDVDDYIERSGGLNKRADKDRIYVVKANGRVFLPDRGGWFKRGGVKIEAGDTVVVPLDADRIESLTLWTSVSQIFYQIALGAAAVNSF